VNGDTLSGALATTAVSTSNVGGYAITQGTLAAGNNYNVTFTTGTLTVTARPLTVTADNASRVYGDANPTFAWAITAGSLVGADSLTGALATLATGDSNVGSYGITQGSLSAGANYAVTFAPGMLTINPRALTVAVNNQSRIYGDANPAFTGTITSGSLHGSTTLADLLASAPATANVGDYAITQASTTMANNYALTITGGTLTVTPATLTITATPDQWKVCLRSNQGV
jgi:hypothetical protein